MKELLYFVIPHLPTYIFILSLFLDILALADSIKQLCAVTRRARTSMWCALMVTLHSGKDKTEVKPDLTNPSISAVTAAANTMSNSTSTATINSTTSTLSK